MPEPVMVPSLSMSLAGEQPVTGETAPHWTAAAEGRFTVPTCDDCGTNRWPVSYACYVCGSRAWSWQPVPGTGTVYTYTWLDSPTHPTDELDNVSVIELDDTLGEPVRVPGWVVGVDKSTLVCGLPVEMGVDVIAEGVGVPHWVPRD
jgi:hypothetical protein